MSFKRRVGIYLGTWLFYAALLLIVIRHVPLEAGMSRTGESVRMLKMLPLVFAFGLVAGLEPYKWPLLISFWFVMLLLPVHAIAVVRCRSQQFLFNLWLIQAVASVVSAWGYLHFIQNLPDGP